MLVAMRVLLLADGSFATRERALLARLEVGLADEGVRVVRVTPVTPAPESLDNPYLRWIRFPEPSSRLLAPISARAVLQDLEDMRALSLQDAEPIDLVHVLGDHAWNVGERIAAELECGAVFELSSSSALHRAISKAKALRSGDEEARRRVCFLCPDEGVERTLADAAPWVNRRLALWGVHSPAQQVEWPRRASTRSVLLIGPGRDLGACRDALEGLALIRKSTPNLLVFLDAALVRDSSNLWKHAERLKMLDCLSVIDDTESRRELSLQVDALLVPERLDEHRTIILDAMAHNVLVFARAGCPMTAVRPDDTAVVLDRADPEDWERALGAVLNEPERASALCDRAARFVRETRFASAHVRGALAAYESALGPPATPFPSGARVR